MHPVVSAQGTRVVQILGGVGSPSAEVHAAHLTRRLAELIRGEALFLPAPGVVGSRAARTVLLDDPFVKAATSLFEKVTVALVGIGTIEPSGLLASSGNVFSSRELESVRELGGVGDICLRFFDATGRRIASPLNDRVIGMDLAQLRHLPKSVGVAAGGRKLAAIRGALQGRYINCLITDRATAEHLLDDEQARPAARHEEPVTAA
jgi:DNA-binding transcriptional regulator LsrR (DeoR family)